MKITFKDYKLLDIDEHKKILSIRNLPKVRENSLDLGSIELDWHLKWVESFDNGLYFAVLIEDEIYGGINLKNDETETFWGVFFRQDLSVILLSVCVYSFLEFAFLRFDLLNSVVKTSNKNSLAFTKNFGFKEIKRTQNEVKLSQNIYEWQEFKAKKFIKKVDNIAKSYKINFKVKNDS